MDWKAWKFLAVSVRSRERCFGVAFSNYNGWGDSQSTAFVATSHTKSLLLFSPLSSGFFSSTFFPPSEVQHRVRKETAEFRRNQRTAALTPPEHSPEPRLPAIPPFQRPPRIATPCPETAHAQKVDRVMSRRAEPGPLPRGKGFFWKVCPPSPTQGRARFPCRCGKVGLR
jgi:hypothetical protein